MIVEENWSRTSKLKSGVDFYRIAGLYLNSKGKKIGNMNKEILSNPTPSSPFSLLLQFCFVLIETTFFIHNTV